jgi:hypothetical protein
LLRDSFLPAVPRAHSVEPPDVNRGQEGEAGVRRAI